MERVKKPLGRLPFLILLLASFEIPLIAFASPEASANLGERRQNALKAAREGQYDLALPAFVMLTNEDPNDLGIKADYIVILTWAKRNQEAFSVAATIDIKLIPNYCLNALAKAARDSREFTMALGYYEQLLLNEGTNLDAMIGKALTLSESGEFVKAQEVLTELRQHHPKNTEVLRALSYFGQLSKKTVVVIDANERLLELNNNDFDAARTLITAVRESGAMPQALALASKYPKAIDEEEIDRINNDSAAQYIAWSHFNSSNPTNRFADTDKALAKLDEACHCDWKLLDLSSDKNKNLIFDRMIALRDRYRMSEVIAHYLQLCKVHENPPSYVLVAVGDAYLYKHFPEEALEAYEAVLQKVPDNIEAKFSKFYTLIELERFEEATKLIDEVSQSLLPYRNRRNNPVIREDDRKLEADNKSIFARAYADDLDWAEKKFQALNNIGPMNNEIRMSLAEIWRWRGWSERAEKRFYEISQDYPDQVSPKINVANTHLDLRDWKKSETEIKVLESSYPENVSVNELNQRWTEHKERQLEIETFSGKSSGSALGSRSQGLNATLYSSPINYNYRAFVTTKYEHATFPEGSGHVNYPAIGLEYTDKVWRLTTDVSQPSYSNIGPASNFTADYKLNDLVTFTSDLELNTKEMPLRGLRIGKTGNLFSASGIYRWSDLMRGSVGITYMDIVDGNKRKTEDVTLDRRLITQPHYKLTAHARLDTSQNTISNANYFNPERDLEAGVILDNEWLQWRRYNHSFSHRLQLGVSDYWQKNFGANTTWIVSYEQQFKWDNGFEIDYGITRNRHSYDGINEIANQFFTRLNLLF